MTTVSRKCLHQVLLLAIALLAAMPARASEEAVQTFLGIPTLGWKIINFVAFFGLLAYLLARPLQSFFASRRHAITEELEAAARQRQEAERLKAETEQRVAALEIEIATLRQRLQEEGERERDALIRQSETEAARLAIQAQQEADRRVADARTELAREAAESAASLARELLATELTPEDRDRIFARTLERLNESRGGSR
jgi:F-type H+-transporting ATPase subunit b